MARTCTDQDGRLCSLSLRFRWLALRQDHEIPWCGHGCLFEVYRLLAEFRFNYASKCARARWCRAWSAHQVDQRFDLLACEVAAKFIVRVCGRM